MRLLKFNVDAQHIQKDPNCDFSGIVAGSKDYLRAHFTFSPEWQGRIIAACFWRGTKEHAVLLSNNECMIPAEALVGPTFRVSVVGRNGVTEVPTDKVMVRQEVSR